MTDQTELVTKTMQVSELRKQMLERSRALLDANDDVIRDGDLVGIGSDGKLEKMRSADAKFLGWAGDNKRGYCQKITGVLRKVVRYLRMKMTFTQGGV